MNFKLFFLILVSITLVRDCQSGAQPIRCIDGRYSGSIRYYEWTPHWSNTTKFHQSSNIEIVQGLPGYSPIVGKNTVVAFTPSPSYSSDEQSISSLLDVFYINPNGLTSTVAIDITGTPANEEVQINHNNNYSVKTNFFVDGNKFTSEGQYLFVVDWEGCSDNRPFRDSLIAYLGPPANKNVKVLFVPMKVDILRDRELSINASYQINNYLSRMPFPSSSYNNPSTDSKYWDMYNGFIPFKSNWTSSGYFDLMDWTTWNEVSTELSDVMEDYNRSAIERADYVVGIYPRSSGWVYASGRASNRIAVADLYGTISHEVGHLFDSHIESSDNHGAAKTWGYFSEEEEKENGCIDWGFDPQSKEIRDSPVNLMSWDGIGYFRGFYTRLYYENLYIEHTEGFTSPLLNSNSITIKTLDDLYVLVADPASGEVKTVKNVGANKTNSKWRAEEIRQDTSGRTWHLTLYWIGANEDSSSNNNQLICNKRTGEFRIVDADFYSNNPSDFQEWTNFIYYQHIAMGVSNFRFSGFSTEDFSLGWSVPQEASQDYEVKPYSDKLHDINFEYTTPFVQWKIAIQ